MWPTTKSTDGVAVADLTSSDFRISRPADVLELVGAGVSRAILRDDQIAAEFFDLSSGFAGELVQKFSNYGLRIAIVGDYEQGRSTSFRQFAQESNRGNRLWFVHSSEDGLKRLMS
jgi:hypothetical protein